MSLTLCLRTPDKAEYVNPDEVSFTASKNLKIFLTGYYWDRLVADYGQFARNQTSRPKNLGNTITLNTSSSLHSQNSTPVSG